MSNSLLASAINILQWLEGDGMTPETTRIVRDRTIARDLALEKNTASHKLVLAWWEALEKTPGTPTDTGSRLATLLSLGNGILLLVGIVLGSAIAGIAFSYQGNFPVNLFALLGVLVGLPLFLLLLSVLLLQAHKLLPRSLLDALSLLSPGRWLASWLEKHIPIGLFDAGPRRPLRGDFARWQLLAVSQTFALGYFTGVLVLAIVLIVFTDLAFGWSTTLDIDPAIVTRVMTALAAPWSAWLPIAVPDQALIESSRFYRLESQAGKGSDAAELGRWWPFVLMTITTYGLLPRVLLFLFANWQAQSALKRLLAQGPEVTALLDRLRAPAVHFEGASDETSPLDHPDTLAASATVELGEDCCLVVWNNVLQGEGLQEFLRVNGGKSVSVISAAEWQQNDELRAQLQNIRHGIKRLVVLAKGWEPPLLAFVDYLELARETIGPNPVLVVVPLAVSLRGVAAADREVWARTLAKGQDPKRYVAAPTL